MHIRTAEIFSRPFYNQQILNAAAARHKPGKCRVGILRKKVFIMEDFIADLMEVAGFDYDEAERAYNRAVDSDGYEDDSNFWRV